MDPFDLPPELLDVERELAERARTKPNASFRRRVLSAVGDEQTASRASCVQRGIWRGVAMLASVVLLSLNLAMSLANHRAWPRAEWIEGEEIDRVVREMRQRHPDLSEQEAYQLAALIRSAPSLAAAPTLPNSLDRIIPLQGEGPWDMR